MQAGAAKAPTPPPSASDLPKAAPPPRRPPTDAGAASAPTRAPSASDAPGAAPPRRPSADPIVSALAGSVSGVFASLLTHPLDVVRTKLAVERWRRGDGGVPRYSGTWGTLATVWREEGRRGLFRGLTPALVINAPAAAVFFGVYKGICGAAPFSSPSANSALGGAAGWVATCLAFNPLYVLKTKQQTQLVRRAGGLKYAGLLSSARVVLREQGVRGLYVGTLAACAGAPGAMLQMPLYERLKGPAESEPSTLRVAAASAASSSSVGLAAYPLEVVRLRLLAQGAGAGEERYVGVGDAFRKIYQAEGLRAFYRGCSTALIRSVPQTAIALMSFESLLRLADLLLQDADAVN